MRVGHNMDVARPSKFTVDGPSPSIICIRVGGHKMMIFRSLAIAVRRGHPV